MKKNYKNIYNRLYIHPISYFISAHLPTKRNIYNIQ